MAVDQSLIKGKKQNNRTSGAAKALKLRKREEAEARNAEYAKLSCEKKMERNSSKVRTKLMRQQAGK